MSDLPDLTSQKKSAEGFVRALLSAAFDNTCQCKSCVILREIGQEMMNLPSGT